MEAFNQDLLVSNVVNELNIEYPQLVSLIKKLFGDLKNTMKIKLILGKLYTYILQNDIKDKKFLI